MFVADNNLLGLSVIDTLHSALDYATKFICANEKVERTFVFVSSDSNRIVCVSDLDESEAQELQRKLERLNHIMDQGFSPQARQPTDSSHTSLLNSSAAYATPLVCELTTAYLV